MIKIIAKTSFDYENIDSQELISSSLSMSEELFGCGGAEFKIPIDSKSLEKFTELKKITLSLIGDGTDTDFFTGFISYIEDDFESSKITLTCEKAWLKSKILFENKNYVSKSIDFILDEILSEANDRNFNEADLLNGNEISQNITKKWEKGTDYQSIINDIAELAGGEWKVSKNKIILKKTIGEDKTTGTNFKEFVSSKLSPQFNNILSISYKYNALDIATSIIGKMEETYTEKESTNPSFPRKEIFISYAKGDDDLTVENDLKIKESSQREISITPLETDFSLSIGDVIGVRIERQNERLDFTGGLKILKKSINVENGVQTITIELSEKARKINNSINYFVDLTRRIKKLETI